MAQETNKIIIKKYISYVFVTVFILFVLNRFYVRPFVLGNDFPEVFQIVVLSLPNFSEAVMGILLITGILLQIRQFLRHKLNPFKTSHVYLAALILASIYVVSQEFRLHNIGGNNVYDPYDLVASLIGLTLAYMTIRKFGFVAIMEE